MTVNILEDTSILSDISELDYANFLSSSKQNFILSQYEHTDHIHGEAVYSNNGIQTSIIQEYYANGTYHYIITYEFLTSYGESMVSAISDALNAARIFLELKMLYKNNLLLKKRLLLWNRLGRNGRNSDKKFRNTK